VHKTCPCEVYKRKKVHEISFSNTVLQKNFNIQNEHRTFAPIVHVNIMVFGYGINQSSKIDLDHVSREVAAQVLRQEPSFASCIGCGTCMATCSAGRFIPFNLRQLQLMVMRGQTVKVRSEAEKCMLCGKCQMICPRGVNTRNVVLALHRFTAPTN